MWLAALMLLEREKLAPARVNQGESQNKCTNGQVSLHTLSPPSTHFGVPEEALYGWQHCRESGQGSAAAPEPLAPCFWGLV